MSVYVDDMNLPATVQNGPRVSHTSQWSHLFADSQDELHAFAERLGLRRSYFQPGRPLGGEPSPFWHYDVTAGKRAQAIRLGATPVAWRDSARIIREREARSQQASAAGRAPVPSGPPTEQSNGPSGPTPRGGRGRGAARVAAPTARVAERDA